MVNIPLLEPLALMETVRLLDTPENLVLTNRLSTQPTPFPVIQWDVIRGSRTVGRPNVPNAEAHIVPRLGRAQRSASLIYYREKKVFSPTTMHWIRAVGSLGSLQTAEDAVLREVTDLNTRLNNLVELTAWQALTGNVSLNYPDVIGNYDFGMATSHKPSAGTAWSSATANQIIADIKAWKRLIQRDARVPATEAFCTSVTLDKIFNAFANSTASTGSGMLSDTMKDQYYRSGTLPGFMGLNWNVVEGQYDTDSGATALFVPDNAIFITNLTDNRPMYLVEGPTADDSAPNGYTGKFTKTWQEEDPSARQALLEYNYAVILDRPDQVVYVQNVG